MTAQIKLPQTAAEIDARIREAFGIANATEYFAMRRAVAAAAVAAGEVGPAVPLDPHS